MGGCRDPQPIDPSPPQGSGSKNKEISSKNTLLSAWASSWDPKWLPRVLQTPSPMGSTSGAQGSQMGGSYPCFPEEPGKRQKPSFSETETPHNRPERTERSEGRSAWHRAACKRERQRPVGSPLVFQEARAEQRWVLLAPWLSNSTACWDRPESFKNC